MTDSLGFLSNMNLDAPSLPVSIVRDFISFLFYEAVSRQAFRTRCACFRMWRTSVSRPAALNPVAAGAATRVDAAFQLWR
jgi:hypothetical protein